MASTSSFLSAIFVLSFLHSFNGVYSNLVQDFCKTTENQGTCLSALLVDPKIGTVTTYHDLALSTLKLAVSNTTSSKNLFVSSKGKYNPDAIKMCIGGFTYAIGSLGSALKEIDQDAQSAGYDAAVANDGANQCTNGFSMAKIQIPSEISTRVGYLRTYSMLGNRVTEHL
ncbi:hypothetical protein ACFE04_024322 [Oxalis oulophora]